MRRRKNYCPSNEIPLGIACYNSESISKENYNKYIHLPQKSNTFTIKKILNFDIGYEKRLFNFLFTLFLRLNLQEKCLEIFMEKAKKLYIDVCNNGLTRKIVHNHDLRQPEKFAIIIAYYSLILNGINHIKGKRLKPALLYNIFKKDLHNCGISVEAKKPKLLSGFLFNYLGLEDQEELLKIPEFQAKLKKKKTFKQDVEKDLDKLVKNLKNFQVLNELTNEIINNLFSNNFNRDNIPTSCRNPINLAYVIIFLSIHHEDYPENYNIDKHEEFLDYFTNLTKLNKTCFLTILPTIYNFLSPKILIRINYLPQDLSIVNQTVLEHFIWKYFDQMSCGLKLENSTLLRDKAVNFYSNMLENGFSYAEFTSQKIQSLSAALLFLSLQAIDNKNKNSRNALIDKLRDIGYLIDEHKLGPILNYIHDLISIDDIDFRFHKDIDSELFERELAEISSEHSSFNRNHASTFTDLILSLFKLSQLNPRDFAEKLGIFSKDPSQILTRIENSNVLTRVDIFLEMVEKIRIFIENYVPKELKRDQKSLLSEIIKYFDESKKFIKHKQYQRVKKRREQYGSNYISTKIRLTRMIMILGFSIYDGYDFMENKYRDSNNNPRMNAQFHHLDYDPSNDNERNLNFLPSKHPKDTGQIINYMTHDYISGLEANLKDERTSIETKQKAQKELEIIKNRNLINESIIFQAFCTKNENLLNDLIGWDEKSISKIKIRLRDLNLEWTFGLYKFIPKEKYGKKISIKEFNDLLEKLRKIKNK